MVDNTFQRQTLSGIAVDLGGTKLAVARFKHGALIDRHEEPTKNRASAQELVDQIVTLIQRVNVQADDTIGVAVTGRVDQLGRWYAVNSSTLSAANRIPLQHILTQRLDQSCVVLNDAVAGALAEYQLGAGIGCQRLLYLTVSTGVGAGIILDGMPLSSPHGLAGHAGFMSSRFATQVCGCGREATVESIASGNAIAQVAHQLGHSGLSAKDVFERHYSGQKWATEIIQTSARAIAELCSDLVSLLEIELVVLGGSIGQLEWYRKQVETCVNTQPTLFRAPVRTASLGHTSVLIGALINSQRQYSSISSAADH